jgi:hypothetical protein
VAKSRGLGSSVGTGSSDERDGRLSRKGWVAIERGMCGSVERDGWLSREGWVAKSLVCLLPTAALCVGNQTTLKIHYWGT